jgi:MFS family permease
MKTNWRSSIRPFLIGLLPLFMLSHFGHHVVGAMLNPLMPMIRADLGLNYTEAGILMSVFSITGGIAQLPAGWLADRFGARLMILLSVTGVAIGGLLIGLSTTYAILVVLLGVIALLGGGYHPAASTAISNITPPEKRGRSLGLHLIGGTSSFWVVTLLVAPMAAAWGWRMPFVVLSIPIIVLGVVLFYFIGRRSRVPVGSTPQTTGKTSIVSDAVKIRWSVFLPFLVLTVGTGMIVQSVGAYYSMYAADHLKVAPAVVVLLMGIGPFVGMFAAPLGGYLSDRVGAIPVVIGSALIAGPLLYTVSLASNAWIFAVILVLIGITNMARAPSSEAYFVTHIPARRRATILGIYFFAGMELAGVMTPLAGKLIDSYDFAPVLIGAAISQFVLAVVCALFLRKTAFMAHTAKAA